MIFCLIYSSFNPCLHQPNNLLLSSVITLILIFLPITTSQLSFNYSRFIENDDTLLLQGDVYHEHNALLQLTQCDVNESFGRVVYYKNMHLYDKRSGLLADFSTNFTFIINSSRNVAEHGDGLTFFLAIPEFPVPNPPYGGGIGLLGKTNDQSLQAKEYPFVAIEFDTFVDEEWDPEYEHVGILINSMDSSNYSKIWFAITDGRTYNASISFNSSTCNLSVSFTGYQNDTHVEQQYLYAIVDLKEYLPDYVEFGFSSSSRFTCEEHTLLSWAFSSSYLPNDDISCQGWSWIAKLSFGTVIFIVFLVLTWFAFWKIMKRATEQKELVAFNFNMDVEFERGSGAKRFPYKELERATNKFSDENKLGEGGFGAVYKGHLRDPSSTPVAIKKISKGSKQGTKEYASEVKIISQLRHKNLVKLIGWCHQNNDLLLIYDYLSNGSLDLHLFKAKSELTWQMRVNIARGIASGLLYLHEEWEQCVVHRDIKSSNVMLNANFVPKLGDFGLARVVDHSKGSKTTVLAGTLGYIAPEYVATGKASRKTDVFSFGVVVLEIVSGRRSLDLNYTYEQQSLVDWVWKLYETGNLLEAADPRLRREFDEKEMERLMMVGLWCVHPDFNIRPTIRQAMLLLNFETSLSMSVPQLPIPKSPTILMLCELPSSRSLSHGMIDSSEMINSPASSYEDYPASSISTTSSSVLSPSAALLEKHRI